MRHTPPASIAPRRLQNVVLDLAKTFFWPWLEFVNLNQLFTTAVKTAQSDVALTRGFRPAQTLAPIEGKKKMRL